MAELMFIPVCTDVVCVFAYTDEHEHVLEHEHANMETNMNMDMCI